MFSFEKIVFCLFLLLLGFTAGTWIGYIRGQESLDNQINRLQTQLKECSSNVVTIGKVKGKGTAEIIQKMQKEPANPFVFGCKQDTAGIVKWFCELPRKERRKIEKDLD